MKGLVIMGLGYLIGNEKGRAMAVKTINKMGEMVEETIKTFNGKENENGKDKEDVSRITGENNQEQQ